MQWSDVPQVKRLCIQPTMLNILVRNALGLEPERCFPNLRTIIGTQYVSQQVSVGDDLRIGAHGNMSKIRSVKLFSSRLTD